MIKLGGIGTILIVAFLLWVLSAGMPKDKIARACEPVDWIGSVATSLAALSADSWGEKTDRAFANFNYGCQYTVWRFFYEDAYQKAVRDGRINPATGSASSQAGETSREPLR